MWGMRVGGVRYCDPALSGAQGRHKACPYRCVWEGAGFAAWRGLATGGVDTMEVTRREVGERQAG